MFRSACLTLLFSCLCALTGAQGLSRGQIMRMMYQVNMAHEAGRNQDAIAKLDSLSRLYPRMTLLYLRQAEIYTDMANDGNTQALSQAIELYRRYLSVEMDAQKATAVGAKLRGLEERMKIPHFEEVEASKARQEVAEKKVLPVILDDASALLLAQESIMLPDPINTAWADTSVPHATDSGKEKESESKDLYVAAKTAAEIDSCQLYRVALCTYYGLGTQADSITGIRLMNRCASLPCGRAAALWLATFYYEKAYENNGLSSISRRTYMEASRYNMALLRMADAPEWYLLKSRMLENAGLAEADSAQFYRRKAESLGVVSLPDLSNPKSLLSGF